MLSDMRCALLAADFLIAAEGEVKRLPRLQALGQHGFRRFEDG